MRKWTFRRCERSAEGERRGRWIADCVADQVQCRGPLRCPTGSRGVPCITAFGCAGCFLLSLLVPCWPLLEFEPSVSSIAIVLLFFS